MLLSDYKWFAAEPVEPDGEANAPEQTLIVRRLGLQDYGPIFQAMKYRAQNPQPGRSDEIWFLSHKPVFTQGQAGKAEHVLNPAHIPVVQVDRGGQVTYHGPGQLVAYLLLNMRRRKLGARALVELIQRAIVTTLAGMGIDGIIRPGAPGVYVNDAKIAALGLRIKNGWSYHGLSLNVSMDLEPFSRINPCGFEKLAVTQIADFTAAQTGLMKQTRQSLTDNLLQELGHQSHYITQQKSDDRT